MTTGGTKEQYLTTREIVESIKKDAWPAELHELADERERAFVAAYVANGGNGSAAVADAGYECTTAASRASKAYELLGRDRVRDAVIALSKRMTRSLAPKAVRAIQETLEGGALVAPRDRLRAADMVLSRTDQVANKVDIEHTVKFDPVKITIELIAEQKRQGLSRDEIKRFVGLTEWELQHYEQLAAKDAPIDAEFKELPAPDEDPDKDLLGE
ncbi:MAG TPA: hypothetical protein VHD59_06885 [Pseudolabrys sp.]|nr:hypothetical protein [Pseudolabrys sp.]